MYKKCSADIERLLSNLDKEQLCDFIRRECAGSEQLQKRFMELDRRGVSGFKYQETQSLVEEMIENYAWQRGYVECSDAFALNRAICAILDDVDVAIKDQRWDEAMAILEGVSAAAEDIISCGDDSTGMLGNIVENCFAKWLELCGSKVLPAEVQTRIFNLSIDYFSKGHLKGFDWWWSWIEMAVLLADTSKKQECIIRILDNIVAVESDDWSIEYNARMAKQYKLALMSKCGTVEEQLKFMYDNVDVPDFRNKLLTMAWDRGDYDEVLRLAQDGVKCDSERYGLVSDWRKWELKVYRHKDDRVNAVKVAQYFFFTFGGFGEKEYTMENMYALMKSLVPQGEWGVFVDSLAREAWLQKDNERLSFIYTQEKMWAKYIDYLRNVPTLYNLDAAPQELIELYKGEFISMYASSVRDFLQSASNRNSYCEGVVLLRKLIGYGGRVEAEDIVAEQKIRKPRRPALLDELSKL